jgi:hypothetical protein
MLHANGSLRITCGALVHVAHMWHVVLHGCMIYNCVSCDQELHYCVADDQEFGTDKVSFGFTSTLQRAMDGQHTMHVGMHMLFERSYGNSTGVTHTVS